LTWRRRCWNRRGRAAAEGFGNIAFRDGDARSTGLPSASFDCVICVFGVFFASDMPAFVAEMWRLVRPSGRLAVTTWGPGLFEPANSIFWGAVRKLEPRLFKAFNPWDEITTATALRSLFERSGIESAVCEAVPGQHRLDAPKDFWDVVLGSGYRATVESLAADKREALREHVLAAVRDQAVTVLRTDVVYGIAERG
jgi:SAM-dependent methyltransferase